MKSFSQFSKLRPSVLLTLLVCIGLVSLYSCGQKKVEKQKVKVQQIQGIDGLWDKLIGSWKRDDKNLYEDWVKENGVFKGEVYKLRDKTRIGREFITIDPSKDTVNYRVVVYNQNDGKPVDFILTRFDSFSADFEKKAHDFPTKISYTLIDSLHLQAVISGKIEGKATNIKFSYTRQ